MTNTLQVFILIFLILLQLSQAQPSSYNCSAQPAASFKTYTIKSQHIEARFIRYGATLTHLLVKDRDGLSRDIVLGYDDAIQYCSGQHPYFGATIGRVANRISHGKFTLNGINYTTPLNEPADTLHGGWVGFDRRNWQVLAFNDTSITFHYFSSDGEEGFPGNVWVNVTYSVSDIDDQGQWHLTYSAKTDSTTIVSLTNHAYFNLNANVNNTATVLDHQMRVSSAQFLQVDADLLPTGQILSNKAPGNHYMDFSSPKAIGQDIDQGTATAKGGYDNAFIFDQSGTGSVVDLTSPLTGIKLELFTDQTSLQFYSGNFLDGTIPRKQSQSSGSQPQYYQFRGTAVLEAQGYPDAINHEHFPQCILHQGEQYIQYTTYRFSAI